MRQPASLLLGLTGFAVAFTLTAGEEVQARGRSTGSSAAQLGTAIALEDHVVLQRRFSAVRGVCTGELGVPTDRVFPDGTQELFVVPPGKALVLTDIEGEITKNVNAAWPVGAVGYLTATLVGAVANQHVRARAAIDADAVSAGIVTMKLHLQTGVVVDSGASVCLRAIVVYSTGISSAHVGTDVRLHGYLIAR